MDEAAARRVLLAQAIETADTGGRLIAAAERDQVDLQSRQDALHHAGGRAPMPPADFVHLRAQRLLAHVGLHHPHLVALQEPRGWQPWLEWIAPLGALVLGVATDAIANVHRVDLISLPLLGIVAWNVAMYLLIFFGLLLGLSAGKPGWVAGIGRWSNGGFGMSRRSGDPVMQATVRFHGRWFQATQGVQAARIQRVLHLSAAAWAAGVILSLLVRGLVVEYRVGWESTFLGPQEVHGILSVLRVPALLFFRVPDFTVEDVARLRFSEGGGAAAGAPWVWMYVALLVSVVILPRLALALMAAWRESRLARHVQVDLKEPYFERIVSLLSSTRLHLGLIAHRDEDRARFLRAVAPEPEKLPILVSSPVGDVMRLIDIPQADRLPDPPPDSAARGTSNSAAAVAAVARLPAGARVNGWLDRMRSTLGKRAPLALPGPDAALEHAREDCDVVLHLVGAPGDEAKAAPLLIWLGKPTVTVRMHGQPGPGDELAGDALPFDSFARTWIGDRVLLDAIAKALPEARRRGFEQIVRAWDARNEDRLQRAMGSLANHLLFAARQIEEVHAGTVTVRSLLPAEREAQSRARQGAVDRIAQRLDSSAQSLQTQLRSLHRVDESAVAAVQGALRERFTVQQPVDAPQAGMAGAASGAAMGASVDLVTGGLTLGAAAALGALVGGGAAFVAAAWKNRSTPGGATVIQLSDAMLEALLEDGLLRYLAVVHAARGVQGAAADWPAETAARVQAHRPVLNGYWNAARTQPNPDRLVQPLAHELASIARAVLMNINL